jgi:4-azaleucine resistance transporter AzlC
VSTTMTQPPETPSPRTGSAAPGAHHTRAARTARHDGADRAVATAVRDVTPVVISLLPFATVLGVTIAASATVPTWLGLASGLLLFAGSAQLVVLSLLDTDASAVAVVATALVVNARLAIYGAAMEPRFRGQPAWFRWFAPHTLVDQTFGLADARPELRGIDFRRYWLTAGAALAFGWTAAMTAGVLGGDALERVEPLRFAAVAVLLSLVVPRLKVRRHRVPALLAAVATAVGTGLPYGVGILLGAAIGLTPSLLHDRSTP